MKAFLKYADSEENYFQQHIPNKLKLDIYPYEYARVSAMKGKLIPKSEYQKLLKLELQSFIRYLEDTDYKEALVEMSKQHSGIQLVERATWKNTADTFAKLLRISSAEPLIIIRAYSKRWDYQNLLTVIRAINARNIKYATNAATDAEKHELSQEIQKIIMPIGTKKPEFFMQLLDAEDADEAIKNSGLIGGFGIGGFGKRTGKSGTGKSGTGKNGISANITGVTDTTEIAVIETMLYRAYYSESLALADALPQGNAFADFLKTEIDILNIKTLLRLIREQFPAEAIKKHLIYSGLKLGERKLNAIASAPNLDEAVKMLKKTAYGNLIINTQESLIDAELALEKFLITESFLKSHKEMLTVISILSYMLAKEIEARNLRVIAKAKASGIDADYIETKLLAIV